MSLLRLLSTGKSLVGLEESNPRYRMGDPRSLPKFGSTNPFQTKKPSTQPEQPATPAATPVPASTPAKKCAAGTTASKAAASIRAGWWARLRSLWGKRRRTSAPAQLSRPAIQGELSLDRVKVMRNDLSDADLEVVAASPRRSESKSDTVLLLAPEPAPGASPAAHRVASPERRLVEAGGG